MNVGNWLGDQVQRLLGGAGSTVTLTAKGPTGSGAVTLGGAGGPQGSYQLSGSSGGASAPLTTTQQTTLLLVGVGVLVAWLVLKG